MSTPLLAAEAGLGSSVPTVAFQTTSQAVCVTGQKLKFASCTALTEPDETIWHAGSSPHGISLVATCAKASLFAYTERTLEPKIYVCSYPDMMPRNVLELPIDSTVPLEFTAIAFSRSGEQIAALCGLPEPTLVVWSLKSPSAPLAVGPLVVPTDGLSFDPASGGALCTMASKRLLVWQLKLVYKTYMLDATEVELDGSYGEASTSWTAHTWGTASRLYVATNGGVVSCLVDGKPTIVLRASSGVSALLADSTHLLVGGGDGLLKWFGADGPLEELSEEACLFSTPLEAGVTSLTYSPDYKKVLAGTAAGETRLVSYTVDELPMSAYNASALMTVDKVLSFHTAAVVAAAPLPVLSADGSVSGYDVVTCSLDGTLRCVDALTRMEVARMTSASAEPPSALATSPSSMLIALGSADGVLRLYTRRTDAVPLLTLTWRGKLSGAKVSALAFAADGGHLAAACGDGTLVMLKLPRGAAAPTLLPHMSVGCGASCIAFTASGALALATTDRKLYLVSPPAGAPGDEADLTACPVVVTPDVIASLVEAPPKIGSGAAGKVALLAACADKKVCVFEMGTSASASAERLEPSDTVLSTAKPPTSLALSMNGAFLAVGAADGSLTVLPVPELSEGTSLLLHDSVAGGVSGVAVVPDVRASAAAGSSLAYSVGHDGTMLLTTISPGGYETPPAVAEITPRPMGFAACDDKAADLAVDVGDAEVAAEGGGGAGGEMSVMAAAKVAANSGLTESAARDALFEKVEGLRQELLALMKANEELPDDDLEKLLPTDFIIDLGQQEQWREEGTQQVAALKASIAEENLANELVGARMKGEFWDAMAEPSTTLHAMVVPGVPPNRQPGTKVASYTMPKAAPATTQTLGFISQLRAVELKVDAWEASDSGVKEPPYRTDASFEAPATFAHDIGRVLSDREKIEMAQEAKGAEGKEEKKKEKKEEEGEGDDEAAAAEAAAAEAAAAEASGTKLYAPFELHTKWRKVSQMSMQGEVQGQLKSQFNEMLKGLINSKRAELEKIKEKQTRILEIEGELSKLGSASDGEPTLEMGMHLDEEPEKLLEVTDAEISAEKWVSPAERARLAKLEEERLAREAAAAGDNLGVRGLKEMMDGTLEIKKAEDELFLELVKPDALLRQEAGEELLDDDKALVKEFLEKQKKLDAEREKRSKGLLTELAKLRVEIQDICNAYNERVKTLKETKMAYDGALYESELLVIRLAQSRLNKETFEKRSTELDAELVTQKESNKDSSAEVAIFKDDLEKQEKLVEQLTADDKALEKAFRRDFADTPDYFEALKKLYNRRKMVSVPKGSAKKGGAPPAAKKAPSGAAMLGIAVSSRDGADGADGGASVVIAGGRDPFQELDAPEMEQMVEPLDPGVDMPTDLSFDVWDRLVEARNAKVESEDALKAATTTLSSMQELHEMLFVKDSKLKQRIEVLTSTLGERGSQELRGDWNLELPFKLKQGQVEVEEAAVVTDFGGALLIHRSEVADLNGQVRQLGREKVVILKEIRDFRKGIVMLEWENQRADMEAADLIERTKEFQLLRVTKDLQGKIRGGSEDNQQVEVAALEKKLDQLKAAHEDKIADLRRQVAKINAMIADRNNEMESLQGQIEQLEGSVLEREMIHEIQAQSKDAAGDSFKRFEELHMKRKLQTLVGMQTQEIGLLRDELDRLRRRTFPTFTHIDNSGADRGP